MLGQDWVSDVVVSERAGIECHRAGKGPLVCLLPSTGRGARDLGALGDALVRRGYRVLLPEPRGIGRSRGAMSGLSFVDLAADVAQVIAAEPQVAQAGARVTVAGHAFGCWIARTLAQNHPNLVADLVLVAAGGLSWDPALSRAIEVAMHPDAPRADRLAALRKAFFAPASDPEPWLEGWYPPVVKMQRDAKGATAKADWWDAGDVPVLDIIARQDPFRPPASHDDFSNIFKARTQIAWIDGASHALPDERPDETAEVMAQWLQTRSVPQPEASQAAVG